MKRFPIFALISITAVFFSFSLPQGTDFAGSGRNDKTLIYKFNIREQIAAPVWRITQKSFEEANQNRVDYILIHMNTYGGLLDAADSIRSKILNSKIPVLVFIDNNAASAGALISIACDSIYMRPGSSIGAATVVDASGEVVPDKYQSFMRSTMRATAESHGKDTIITGTDTTITWHRDPQIAEAMVDPKVYIESIIDTGQVLTFTTEEAIKHGYCEGQAENIEQVLAIAGISNYTIIEFVPTALDKVIGFLIHPIVHGLLIMIIIGGIYFELQTPGVGFPLAAALFAAVLYFAPLYLEGLAEHWELVLFFVGIVLIAVEIFAIPGFGVAGVSGIILMVTGLALSMIDNIVFSFDGFAGFEAILKALFIVITSSLLSLLLSLWISKKLFTSRTFPNLALNTVQDTMKGFVGVESKIQKETIGKKGIAHTLMRPSGKVLIEGEIYDAKSETGYIEKGNPVKVIRDETGQIYVVLDESEKNEA
jgi:membrane-bound serine protease (ClpP class)